MKVTGFEVFPVVCPPPFRGGRNWLFVRLDTDSGTRGYGEMTLLGTGFRLPVLATMMADIIEQNAQFVDPPFEWHDGYLMPPRAPGLGFNLREDVARSHAPHGPQPGTIRSY